MAEKESRTESLSSVEGTCRIFSTSVPSLLFRRNPGVPGIGATGSRKDRARKRWIKKRPRNVVGFFLGWQAGGCGRWECATHFHHVPQWLQLPTFWANANFSIVSNGHQVLHTYAHTHSFTLLFVSPASYLPSLSLFLLLLFHSINKLT